MLQMAEKLAQAKVPENVWYIVYQNEAAESKPRVVHGGDQAGQNGVSKGHAHSRGPVHLPASLDGKDRS